MVVLRRSVAAASLTLASLALPLTAAASSGTPTCRQSQLEVAVSWPLGGAAADRLPKRSLLVATQTASMALAFALAGLTLGGAVRPMTVMFVDLAGFTGMSERLGDRIIPLLSRYFESVSAQIQANGGTIDKFIGDAVMAFWGAPAPNTGHAFDACCAALALLTPVSWAPMLAAPARSR